MSSGRNDPASLGAEALPAGYSEISKALRSHTPPNAHVAREQQPNAPLVGLIALAAHWLKKRGDRD